jgi:CBS domain containing-hemolysin-like protein
VVYHQWKYQYVAQSLIQSQFSHLFCVKLLAVLAAVTQVLQVHLSVIFVLLAAVHQAIYQYVFLSLTADDRYLATDRFHTVLAANVQVEYVIFSQLATFTQVFHQKVYQYTAQADGIVNQFHFFQLA